jgi:hypothetical protein
MEGKGGEGEVFNLHSSDLKSLGLRSSCHGFQYCLKLSTRGRSRRFFRAIYELKLNLSPPDACMIGRD